MTRPHSQSWYASDATRNLILLSLLIAIVASVLFIVGYIVPAGIAEINHGYLQVAQEHRETEYQHQLQWESLLDRFFVLRCNLEGDE